MDDHLELMKKAVAKEFAPNAARGQPVVHVTDDGFIESVKILDNYGNPVTIIAAPGQKWPGFT